MLSEAHDLAIVQGDGNIPGWECLSIVTVEMVAAATPAVAIQAEKSAMVTKDARLSDAPPLLAYENLTPDWINWQTRLNRLGLPSVENQTTRQGNSCEQPIGKAL